MTKMPVMMLCLKRDGVSPASVTDLRITADDLSRPHLHTLLQKAGCFAGFLQSERSRLHAAPYIALYSFLQLVHICDLI